MEKIEEKAKRGRKSGTVDRGEKYYLDLTTRIISNKNGFSGPELRKLIQEVNVEYDYSKYYCIPVINKLEQIFTGKNYFLIEKDKKTNKITTLLMDENPDRKKDIKDFFENAKKEFSEKMRESTTAVMKARKAATESKVVEVSVARVPSKEDKERRDAIQAEIEHLLAMDPTMDRREAYEKALETYNKRAKRRNKVNKGKCAKALKNLYNLVSLCNVKNNNGSLLDYNYINDRFRKVVKPQDVSRWVDIVQPYAVVSITYANRHQLQVNGSIGPLMEKLEKVGEKEFGITLKKKAPVILEPIEKRRLVKVSEQRETTRGGEIVNLPWETRFIIFAMGGLIVHYGKAISPVDVISLLRRNHYKTIEETTPGILEIVKDFPDLFEKTGQGNIVLAGKTAEAWSKIRRFSPHLCTWEIPWVINSGLGLEKIQEFFPESYQVREDINVGSKVIIVKTDRSIRSFQKLARLQMCMRDTDFPICTEDPGLVEKLVAEQKIMTVLVEKAMLSRDKNIDDIFTQQNEKDKDKLLYIIEEEHV